VDFCEPYPQTADSLPVVVSGDPNIIPIFSLSWLIKITVVSVLETTPLIFLNAFDNHIYYHISIICRLYLHLILNERLALG
jgi:hypothetical protein